MRVGLPRTWFYILVCMYTYLHTFLIFSQRKYIEFPNGKYIDLRSKYIDFNFQRPKTLRLQGFFFSPTEYILSYKNRY